MLSRPTRTALCSLAAVTAILCALPLLAETPATRPATPAYFSDASGLALHGYDVVSYFEKKPATGSPEITATHAGLTFRFVSDAHRKAFAANPEKYLPQYGGYCAYGVAKGHKAPTTPTSYAIHNGKLYLNYNDEVAKMWLQDPEGLINEADEKWPAMKDESGPQAK
jgi:YHS domain-containing protein